MQINVEKIIFVPFGLMRKISIPKKRNVPYSQLARKPRSILLPSLPLVEPKSVIQNKKKEGNASRDAQIKGSSATVDACPLALVNGGVYLEPVALHPFEQVQNLALNLHFKKKKKIVIKLVHGPDKRPVRSVSPSICQTSAMSCQEPRAGTAAYESTRNWRAAEFPNQRVLKLWSA